ncbi:MAG: hypothetical protein J6V72_05705 [Kiritimatiellae bacterium]|nr:hypothetical protein [Kiritimatiellia bacterium]
MKQMEFQDVDAEYAAFIDEFKSKKTTEDCYTPANVYDAVRAWAVREYNLAGREIVRPFWPGEDYQRRDYPAGCVVIDNPPFSIISRIVRWFYARRIDYFLFSPYLTNLGIGAGGAGVNHVIAPCSVLYENGATVDTAFVTNLGADFIRSAIDLMDALNAANDVNLKAARRTLPKYVYPDCVLTSAAVGYMCKHRPPFAVRRNECEFIRKLDAQGKDGGIFGAAYLLSSRCALRRAAAERAATKVWELSPRERALQALIDKREGAQQ